ncbi:MAG: 4Fe-4S dicluster domain-containing protein [Pseudomonadota bacterium]
MSAPNSAVNAQDSPPLRVGGEKMDIGFSQEVELAAGTPMRHCLSCMTCSGGCPFFPYMDFGPHGVMRRVIFGLRKEVLESSTIWLCVGCQTCAAACPMAIDICKIMDALRQMAIEEGAAIAQPDILSFHREVLESVRRYGRTHKLEIMLRFKVRTRSFFSDMDLGLKMFAKRKLDLRPSKIKNPKEIARLFSRPWRR